MIRLLDLVEEAVDVPAPLSRSPPACPRRNVSGCRGSRNCVIRYLDLSQNPQSNVTFTWDKMLSLGHSLT